MNAPQQLTLLQNLRKMSSEVDIFCSLHQLSSDLAFLNTFPPKLCFKLVVCKSALCSLLLLPPAKHICVCKVFANFGICCLLMDRQHTAGLSGLKVAKSKKQVEILYHSPQSWRQLLQNLVDNCLRFLHFQCPLFVKYPLLIQTYSELLVQVTGSFRP